MYVLFICFNKIQQGYSFFNVSKNVKCKIRKNAFLYEPPLMRRFR